MSEKHRAQHYQEHKDDEELWGDEDSGPATPRRTGLGATITVRFPEEDAELIRALAKRTGVPYSQIVREAVRTFVRPRFTIDYDVLSHFSGPLALPTTPMSGTFGDASTATAPSSRQRPEETQPA